MLGDKAWLTVSVTDVAEVRIAQHLLACHFVLFDFIIL